MDEAQKLFDSKYTGLQIEEAIAAGLELRNDPQLALANLGGRPQRNFADNARFAKAFLVNQRGQTSYSITGGVLPCFDRWMIWGNVIIEEDCVTITKTSPNPEFFVQIIPNDYFLLLRGNTVTLSVVYREDEVRKIKSSTSVIPKQGVVDTTEIDLGGVLVDIIQEDGQENARIRFFSLSQSVTVYPEAVELVLGDHQTIVYTDKNGDLQFIYTPDYGAELARCQQYGLFSKKNALYAVPLSIGQAFLPTPVTMRAKPAIVGTPIVYNADTNGEAVGATVSVLNATQNGVLLQLSGASAPTRGYVLFPAGTGLSAEL